MREEKKEATRETPCARVCVRNVRRPRCETACRVRLSIGHGYSGVPKIRSAIAIFFSHNRPNLIPQRGDLGERVMASVLLSHEKENFLRSRMLRFARGDNLRHRRGYASGTLEMRPASVTCECRRACDPLALTLRDCRAGELIRRERSSGHRTYTIAQKNFPTRIST